ncbi:MAG TPA: PilZ domain-containing protein [Polyangia bacterium]
MKPSLRPRDVRRFDRKSAFIPVVVRAEGNKIQAGVRLDTTDLSEGGLFLRSDLLFEVGEDLTLEIPLGDGKVTVAHGRVAWVTRGSGKKAAAGMGIEFARLSAHDRRALADNLRALADSATEK